MEHGYCSQTLREDIDDEFDQHEEENIGKGSDELLIDAVRGYPHLYDMSSKDYKDGKMKENSWNEIALIMNMSSESCQNRWLRLRERFTKEQRLQQTESRSGSGASRRPIFALYNNMMFLKNHIKRRKSYTNVINPTIKKRIINVSNYPTDKHNLPGISLSHKLVTDRNANICLPNLLPSSVSSHYDIDISPDISKEINITPKTNFSHGPYSQEAKMPETGLNKSSSSLQSEEYNSHTSEISNPSNINSTSIPVLQTMPKNTKSNVGKIKNRSNTYLESSIASLSDSLQNHLANRPLYSAEQTAWNCNTTPEKSFGMLVAVELEQLPEPEKSKRKQAIAQILWNPYTQ